MKGKWANRAVRLLLAAAALTLCGCQAAPAAEISVRGLAEIYAEPQETGAYREFYRIDFGEGKRFIRFSESFSEDGLAVIEADSGGAVRQAVYDLAGESERFYLDALHRIVRIRDGFAIAERNGKLGVYESRTGRRVLDTRYDSVQILTDRFVTADGVLYGVSASGTKELFNPNTSVAADLYRSVTVDTVHNCVLARRSAGYDVLDKEGNVVFPLDEGELILGENKKLTPAGETEDGKKRYRLYSAVDGSEETLEFAGEITGVTELNAKNGTLYNRDLWGWYLVDAVSGGRQIRYLTDNRLNVRHTFSEKVVARISFDRYLAETESGLSVLDGGYRRVAELGKTAALSWGPEGIVCERDGKQGILSTDGAETAAFVYDEIQPFCGGIALARRDCAYDFISVSGVAPAGDAVLAAGRGWYAVSGGDGVTVLKNLNGARLAGMTAAEFSAFSEVASCFGSQFILSAQAVYKVQR